MKEDKNYALIRWNVYEFNLFINDSLHLIQCGYDSLFISLRQRIIIATNLTRAGSELTLGKLSLYVGMIPMQEQYKSFAVTGTWSPSFLPLVRGRFFFLHCYLVFKETGSPLLGAILPKSEDHILSAYM